MWTVSAMRMKREHRVPPCRPACSPRPGVGARARRRRGVPGIGAGRSAFIMAMEAMPRRCVAGRWRPWYRPTVNIEIVTTVLSGAAVLIGVWRMLAKTEGRLGARINRVEAGLNQRIDRLEDRFDQRIDRLDQRIDAVLLADRHPPTA